MDNKERFKGCLLPVFDENVNVFIESNYYLLDDEHPHLITEVEEKNNITDCLGDLIGYGFYYTFNEADIDDNNTVKHFHAHTFDQVVRELYLHPDSFSLNKEDIQYYSKQELVYLNRLRRYLRIAELKDVTDYSVEGLINRVKTDSVKELVSCSLLNSKFGHEIVNGTIKNYVSRYVDFKFKTTEKFLVSTLTEDFIGIVESFRTVMKLSEITEDMIDYKAMGFDSLEEYKIDLVNTLSNSNVFKLDDDQTIVYESFKVIKKINS